MNVEYTPSGASMPQTVLYVASAGKCDAMTGGWYYDNDPAGFETPAKILMCPATCDNLEEVGGQVEIEIGCQTVVPEAE